MTQYLKEIKQTIQTMSDDTGYTPLEIKRLIATNMEPEQIAILFARTEENAHDVIKEICGIPSSVRLGTKEFMQFEERMEQTIAEIAGEVQAFGRRAA